MDKQALLWKSKASFAFRFFRRIDKDRLFIDTSRFKDKKKKNKNKNKISYRFSLITFEANPFRHYLSILEYL